MSDSKRKRIKPDEKQRIKQYLYYTKSNVSVLGAVDTNKADRYLLTLTTFADPTKSLKDIFLYFSHSIFEVDPYLLQPDFKTVPFNKLFEFMVDLYHLHEKYLPQWIKKTEEIDQSVRDIMGRGDEIEDVAIRAILKSRVESLYQQSRARVFQDLEKNNEVYSSKYIQVYIMKQNLMAKCQKEILSIEDAKVRSIYFPSQELDKMAPQYLKKQLNTLMNVQFSRKYYREFKMKDFLKSYKEYFLAQIPYADGWEVGERRLIIKRYSPLKNLSSSNKKEILMNLNDLVDLRDEAVPYEEYAAQHLEMIKQLGNELRNHKLATTNKHYPLLHPKYVIFNQLTLKINLSFEAPLFAALGLLKMPFSSEQAIAFAATPKIFDQYSAPIEILRSSEEKAGCGDQIFYDMFYGMDSLIDAFQGKYKYQKISKPIQKIKGDVQMKDIKLQRQKASEAWRFLMVSSYLLNGREYYKSFKQPPIDFECFKQFLVEQRREIETKQGGGKEYAEKVMGGIFKDYLKKAKMQLDESQQLSLTIFDTFLGVKQQVSEISTESRFWKVNQLLKSRRKLKGDLLEIIQRHKELKRMINITRYFMAFYFILVDSAFNIQLILEFYIQNFKKGRELLKYVGDKINFRDFEQVEEEENALQKAYSKAKEYEYKTEGRAVLQLKYFQDNHQLAYNSVDPCYNTYMELKQRFKVIVFGEQSEGAKDAIPEMMRETSALLLQLKIIILKIVEKQFERTVQALADEEAQKVLLVNSFHTKTRLLLLFNHDNYTELDSLISPILVSEKEMEKKGGKFAQLIPVFQYALEILNEHLGESKPTSETGSALLPARPS